MKTFTYLDLLNQLNEIEDLGYEYCEVKAAAAYVSELMTDDTRKTQEQVLYDMQLMASINKRPGYLAMLQTIQKLDEDSMEGAYRFISEYVNDMNLSPWQVQQDAEALACIEHWS